VKVVAAIILRATNLRLIGWSVLEPWREVIQHEGLRCREGGTLPCIVQTEGNERFLFRIVVRVTEL
jgi:hypothetical protein